MDYKDGFKSEKTVFVFLKDEILTMTYETYSATIKAIDNNISVDEYYKLMEKQHILT